MLRYLLLLLLIGNCADIAFCGRNCSEHKSCNACAESECVWRITINECHNSKIACPASNGLPFKLADAITTFRCAQP